MKPVAIAGGLAALVAWQGRPVAQASSDGSEANQPLEVTLSPIVPGGGEPSRAETDLGRQYAGNQDAIDAGGQLYLALNCVGCHFHGGGGMGPPLMDEEWIYGSSIENIVSTLREGRPAGMPAYRGFVPDAQLWQVAAFVQSLAADAADGSGGAARGQQ